MISIWHLLWHQVNTSVLLYQHWSTLVLEYNDTKFDTLVLSQQHHCYSDPECSRQLGSWSTIEDPLAVLWRELALHDLPTPAYIFVVHCLPGIVCNGAIVEGWQEVGFKGDRDMKSVRMHGTSLILYSKRFSFSQTSIPATKTFTCWSVSAVCIHVACYCMCVCVSAQECLQLHHI